ncbi:MAG: replication-associated recombination protein A [Spirochaetales bacterium]|nr:replication-associated recombination protein A [Spirochaetales bacterium]
MVHKPLFMSPLSELVRPATMAEYIGQYNVAGENSLLLKMIENDDLSSFILWGPPGCGKTTLANIIAKQTQGVFISMSAVTSGIKEVKDIMKDAEEKFNFFHQKTILFIDEIHRFNKAQQDAFLSYVENGSIVLIGATTENPSFSVISPLLSRMRVFILKPLEHEELMKILQRGLEKSTEAVGQELDFPQQLLSDIANIAGGDARRALGIMEMAVKLSYENDGGKKVVITKEIIQKVLQGRLPSYDKTGDYHYDYLSALHKSMRNSDADAALYYAVKILKSGDDPMSVMRRVIQCSSEDIGLADPQALQVAISAREALQALGMPEATLSILQAVVYNALAPKSNSLYVALEAITHDIETSPDLPVPLHIRNAPTKLMEQAGYGKGYKYAHDYEMPITGMQCLPDKLKDRIYYKPKNFGFEQTMAKRLEKIRQIKESMNNGET